MKSKKICGSCGSEDIGKTQTTGPFPWKDYPAVFLTKPVSITACRSCGEHMGPVGEGKKIDTAIENSIKEQLKTFIETILEREHCKQIDIAMRIGRAPEYLSSIKSGANLPGFSIFNFLKTLTINPQAFKAASPETTYNLKRA